MVSFSRPVRLTLPIATTGAALAGVAAAFVALLIPAESLEDVVVRSGAAALFPAVRPPLGWIARLGLAAGAGWIAGPIGWAALFLLVDGRGVRVRLPRLSLRPHRPAVRRADAHPDAPPRAPILAQRDLGTPFLDVMARAAPAPEERPLPDDLTIPLAMFDPGAIPAEPKAPVRALASLAPRPAPLAPGERIETYALSPGPRAEEASSVASLLERLENGARARRARLTGADAARGPRAATGA